MSEIECTAKKWGNSIGVVLPRNIVKEENIRPNEKVVVDIKKTHKAKEFFGLLPQWKVDTQKLKDKLREGWEM